MNPYYSIGYSRGKEVAAFSPTLPIEEILENEEHSRQYSDFTQIAHWLNNSQEPDTAWLLYETGLVAGIDSAKGTKYLSQQTSQTDKSQENVNV